MNLTLQEIANWLPNATLIGDPHTLIHRVHTDTRSLQAGDLFVALKGERFDAHNFLPQAQQAGAVAALAEHGIALAGLNGIEVPNSLEALGRISRHWRTSISNNVAPLSLIAITGSNGKTTVTQMVASILRAHYGDRALATRGNFNNEIGVPLTLFRLQPSHQAAVVELGMNHPGEIARLASIALPTVALVNNAQREHMEFMNSVEAVAQENGSVFKSISPHGVAIYPADDAHTGIWKDLASHCQRMTFSTAAQSQAHVCLQTASWTGSHWGMRVRIEPTGMPPTYLNAQVGIAGEHNLHNALAAIACAVAINVPHSAIAQGLADFHPVQGRMQSCVLQWQDREITLIDDSYNANPDSVRAAIDMLATQPGIRTLVLGDMGEVGDHSDAFHLEIGAYAQAAGLDHLVCLGSATRATAQAFNEAALLAGSTNRALHIHTHAQATQHLQDNLLHITDTLIVKGSRFMAMETIIQHLKPAATSLTTQGVQHVA